MATIDQNLKGVLRDLTYSDMSPENYSKLQECDSLFAFSHKYLRYRRFESLLEEQLTKHDDEQP